MKVFSIPINLSNKGKTPAIITQICARLIPAGKSPAKDNVKHIIEIIPFNEMIGEDIDKREIESNGIWKVCFRRDISKTDWDDFLSSNITKGISEPIDIYCCGKIIYKDIMKKEHTTWFCWKYIFIPKIMPNGCFTRTDNDELNDYD